MRRVLTMMTLHEEEEEKTSHSLRLVRLGSFPISSHLMLLSFHCCPSIHAPRIQFDLHPLLF